MKQDNSNTLSYATDKPWETEMLLEEADGELHGKIIAEFNVETLADGTGGRLHYRLSPRTGSIAWGTFLGGATLTLSGLFLMGLLLESELSDALQGHSLSFLIFAPIFIGLLIIGVLAIRSSLGKKEVNIYEILVDEMRFVVKFNGREIKSLFVKEIRDLWLERVLALNPQLREHVFNLTTTDGWSASLQFMAPFDLNPQPIEKQLRSFLKLPDSTKKEAENP